MLTSKRAVSRTASISQWFRRIPWLLIPVMVLSCSIAHAQQLTGTISGIAMDQTSARIPGATILVSNDATADRRNSTTDSDGFFSVTALIPGTYTVTISAKGFTSWKETGILINQGDTRTLANIHLKVFSEGTAITVVSGLDAEVPVDTAEVSATLNNELVDSATLTGRNAAELMKMMPGVAFNNSGNAGSGYNSTTTGTANGPAGSFSANGTQPTGTTATILDGANLLDPGNAGSQVANINQDMTDSVKFAAASYGAEYAKGPAVLQAFSKSGTQKFHGEAYLYARNTDVGYANDAYNKAQKNPIYPQHFYYVGGNVGGPIFFKGFNKNRDKLFFWGGYEKMYQTPYTSPVMMNVPTTAQMAGDFDNEGRGTTKTTVDKNVINNYGAAYSSPCSTSGQNGCNKLTSPFAGYDDYTKPATQPDNPVPNLANYFDPNGVTLVEMTVPGSTNSPAMKNEKYVTPSKNNGWGNYEFSPSMPVNRWEVTGKVTYAFNDNNKVWGSYAYQSETDQHPVTAWWSPTWTVPYASQPSGTEKAHVYLVNFTHVFSSTTTNEFVFAYSKFDNDFSEGNTKAISRAALNFPNESLFGTSKTDEIPAATDAWWSGAIATEGYFQGSFGSGIYGKNSFGKTSKSPSITDNFTKIIKSHSLKGGFYWDTAENIQPPSLQLLGSSSKVGGEYMIATGSGASTGNGLADRLMGHNYDYGETNKDVLPDIENHEWSIWGQDSWKATPKLTLNLGLRADHVGQWYDKNGGAQVWDPDSYNNTSSAPANTGLIWRGKDSYSNKVPKSGFPSKLFFYNPRLGAAWDVFGTGKTVVRGGAGAYRYQISVNDANGMMTGPLGQYDADLNNDGLSGGFYGYHMQDGKVCTTSTYVNQASVGTGADCSKYTTITIPTGLNQNHSSPGAGKQGDKAVPFAWTWSFGVAQALPSHTVAEVSYVGSASRNQFFNNAVVDVNPISKGAFFQPDPTNYLYENPAPVTPDGASSSYSAVNTSHYRPLVNFGQFNLDTHGGYSNYHSLQVSAQKQSGNLYLFSNFTFSKVLGIHDGNSDNFGSNGPVIDPYDMNKNYGVLAYDHTKIFNVSFSYKLPNAVHSKLLGEAVNGWQISGYTTYQDGQPYNSITANMNMDYHQQKNSSGTTIEPETDIVMPMSPTSHALQNGSDITANNITHTITTSTWFGSSEYGTMMPVLTCDPRKGHKSDQQFNVNCFAAPLPPTATSVGQQGRIMWPYVRMPHYWGSDLAVFKAFKITEAQRAEIRISATNWLNHPNSQFGLASNVDNKLIFNGVSTASALTPNSNTSTTGKPANKTGYRWMQFAAKYYF